MRIIAAIAACVVTGACSTSVESISQRIAVNTNPPGADCGLYRQSLQIATVRNTPGSALIEMSKHDIWIACVKQGYQQAVYHNHPAAATFGNKIFGGAVGRAIDSASGSDSMYDSPITITMVPAQPGQTGPVALPSTFAGNPI